MHQKSQILWRSRKYKTNVSVFSVPDGPVCWSCSLAFTGGTSPFWNSIYAWLRKGQAGFGVKVVSWRDFWVGSGLAHYYRYGHRQKVSYASGCCLSRHVVLFLLGTVVFLLWMKPGKGGEVAGKEAIAHTLFPFTYIMKVQESQYSQGKMDFILARSCVWEF